ncbi:MarR family winged helix-turn-helix transcriptional regulator [Staphylococcus simulans]|uniref:MarR family winged helix-turn-helix transcriptional regulator n=1 Tax=Staphylococcus simulans TaxID=1286 RepID=UPI00070B610D|nr:MarR family transcriptional regulator [Staphylococcus simulans]PTI94541.1 MarR family transcriptional regulator [Staphylococcus simulans]PTJ06557.1 MarR family transcriptional regulator [Staphylococcus simulans]PTJ09613.1 MarR family transcriptional regulator [Staphylococcus simulans]PTJ40358.1 MarR family transcriptional regulator [Staphylococcus simulans]PTJ97211.1 MarR family transcriptional regulator [Staphylococcus simulans]
MRNSTKKNLDHDLCFLFYITTKEVINRFNKFLKQYNISFPNYMVLSYIEDDEEVFVKTLCNKLFLDSGTISPIVKRLEKKNLVIRKRLPEDERKVMLSLTEEGKELKAQFKNISTQVINQLNLDSDEKEDYYNMMRGFAQKNLSQPEV